MMSRIDLTTSPARSLLARLSLCAASLLCAAAVSAQALPHRSAHPSVGVASCASSLCHGSVKEWKDSNVLQTEYLTWSRLDKHANAYRVLEAPRARQIAAKLGLRAPAHQSTLCLDCHAHNVPADRRGPRFDISEGVSCEACHGPAGAWLQSHTSNDASHRGNVERGLYPANDARARAKLCLSCHQGDADRFVSHRLMAAGHPRLSFELETFSSVAPAHYRIDADYRQRKPAADGVQVWAIGQALAVSEMMTVLIDPKRSRDGLFPELVLFDCHACHHPMSEKRWQPKPAAGNLGPGLVRLNDSGLLMLRVIARQLDAALGQRVQARVASLHHAVAGSGDSRAEARAMRSLALDVAARLEARPLSQASLRGIALGLVDEGLAGNYRDYSGAEQATMALGSVLRYMDEHGLLRTAPRANAALARLNATLADHERYQPGLYQQRLRELRQQLVPGKPSG